MCIIRSIINPFFFNCSYLGSAINSRTSQLFMEFSKITRNGEQSSKSAVVIRNAYKRYSPQTVILNGLNMTVPAGNMYVIFITMNNSNLMKNFI